MTTQMTYGLDLLPDRLPERMIDSDSKLMKSSIRTATALGKDKKGGFL